MTDAAPDVHAWAQLIDGLPHATWVVALQPAAVVAAPVEAKPEAPPPPPPPSVQFRAAIEGLKISGVRGGANARVFIGKTAYAEGDLVVPALGISFEGYNPETRMILFKDKTGAKVERRN